MHQLFLSLIFFANLAQAETVSVAVPSPSLSEGLYLCNAGISHFRESSNNSQSACEDANCESDVVMNPASGMDSISYKVSQQNALDRRFAFAAPINGVYRTISALNNGWTNIITELSVGLASETYGAKYFLEFCYLGPIEVFTNSGKKKVDISKGIYSTQVSLFANTSNYIRQSGLVSNISWSCDLRSSGNTSAARKSNELAPSTYEVNASQYVTIPLNNISSSAVTFTHVINTDSNKVPRFCVVRAEFQETSTKVRPSSALHTSFTFDISFLMQELDGLF